MITKRTSIIRLMVCLAALMFLFSLAVLAAAVVFFLIEMLIYWFYRKK
ncbi:MAG: hypothetical protein IKR39_03690 [Lachnospiraceae bacterium]|nr:hypothetical protein [Lachnospiraceae bacterium]